MKKRIWAIILIALVICLLFWRFWPQSLSDVISVDKDSVVSYSVAAMVRRFENGQSKSYTYRIENTESHDTLDEIMEILSSSDYRRDFRNLLPWDLDYVDADKNYDGRIISVYLYTENKQDEYIEIQFLSKSIVAVDRGGKVGFRIYHPTNRETIDLLTQHLIANGIEHYLPPQALMLPL